MSRPAQLKPIWCWCHNHQTQVQEHMQAGASEMIDRSKLAYVQNWVDAHRRYFASEAEGSPSPAPPVYYYVEPARISHVVPAPHLVSPMKLHVVRR